MTDPRKVETDAAPAAIGPYSQAIVVGDWVFTAGQIALDPETGELAPGGVEAEAVRVLENLAAILEAAGASLASVVKTTVFLADLADYAVVNEVYARYFEDTQPARSALQVAALPKGARVEIEAIAHRT